MVINASLKSRFLAADWLQLSPHVHQHNSRPCGHRSNRAFAEKCCCNKLRRKKLANLAWLIYVFPSLFAFLLSFWYIFIALLCTSLCARALYFSFCATVRIYCTVLPLFLFYLFLFPFSFSSLLLQTHGLLFSPFSRLGWFACIISSRVGVEKFLKSLKFHKFYLLYGQRNAIFFLLLLSFLLLLCFFR